MTKSKSSTSSRVGLWSTVSKAVADGWGATTRLLLLLAALGTIAIGLTVTIGTGAGPGLLRALLALY